MKVEKRGTVVALALVLAASGLSARAADGTGAVQAGVDAMSRGDYPAAVRLWQGPAAAGDADAQYNLGMAYKRGLGVPVDPQRAEDLFRKASAQGHLDAGDQYGLLLFQTGRRREALPWLQSAADRGEPRAQYVLGTAHYNGDFVPKDWITAYAFMSRAAAQGLPQATSSLSLMDQSIPLEQRQQGIAVAGEMQKKAEALRNSQLAQADLGAPRVAIAPTAPPRIVSAPMAPSTAGAGIGPGAPFDPAVASGAVGARARTSPPAIMPRPAAPRPVAVAPVPAPVAEPAGGGGWRVQLGAFSQRGNADAQWARAAARPELAGKRRYDIGSGVVRLQAGPFASEAAAARACAGLKAAGLACLVSGR